MLIRDEGIVLRMVPWSNTSRYVAWLCRDQGKVLTLIRGAQRPKSFFLGQADLFYTCDLVYYAREHRSLHTARECQPVRTRTTLRRDWRACAAASYCADVVYRALPFDSPAPGAFTLLAGTLDALASGEPPLSLLQWFDLSFLKILGLQPRLDTCLSCGRSGAGTALRHLAIPRGGLMCDACAERESGEHVRIAPEIVRRLGELQGFPRPAGIPSVSRAEETQVQGILGRFLSYHLNLPLPSRQRAFEACTA